MSSIYMYFKLIHNCPTNPSTLLHDTDSCILFLPFPQAYMCNEYAHIIATYADGSQETDMHKKIMKDCSTMC
jgi:hypothetical protein